MKPEAKPAFRATFQCPACGQPLVSGPEILGGYPLLRCPACGMRFAASAIGTPADYDAIYDTQEYWDEQVSSIATPDPERFAAIGTYRPFFQQVLQSTGRTLLDVGCGVGRFAHAAHARGFRVTGVDVSARAVEIGSRYAPFPMRTARVEELVGRGEHYDVVTAFEVLEHLDDPRTFLSVARSLLSKGGEMFCTVPNWDCREVQVATRPDLVPPVHLSFFTRPALAALMARAGFREVRTGEIGGGPFSYSPIRITRWLAARVLKSRRGLGLWVHGFAG